MRLKIPVAVVWIVVLWQAVSAHGQALPDRYSARASDGGKATLEASTDGIEPKDNINQKNNNRAKHVTVTTLSTDQRLLMCATFTRGLDGGEPVLHYDSCDDDLMMDAFSVATPTFGGGAGAPTGPTGQQARQAALNYLKTLTMPTPVPKMSAPSGICGVRHSVDLQIPPSISYPAEQTPFGTLRAQARGSFQFNWGDNTGIETYAITGAPYPSMAINHFWTDRGDYTINVTANWSLDWQLGGYSGVITGLQTEASIPWHVWEIQAVITE